MPSALITGVAGQTGSFLAEELLDRDYEVYGMIRRTSSPNTERIEQTLKHPLFTLVHGDMNDQGSLSGLVNKIRPTEVYNLAAQSHVHTSWAEPVATGEVNAMGAIRLLEALRQNAPEARFYQASSSEMFGRVRERPQTEKTPFHPRSPYGVAKCYAHYATVNYRESYGMFASCGIAFNHESERRSPEFVTRKITQAVARICAGLQDRITLGDLTPMRDWGYARDYARAMITILAAPMASDYVIATGETHRVQDFVQIAFSSVGLNWQEYVVRDETLVRPAEVDYLCGDAQRLGALGWRPTTGFVDLVRHMLRHDLMRLGWGPERAQELVCDLHERPETASPPRSQLKLVQ